MFFRLGDKRFLQSLYRNRQIVAGAPNEKAEIGRNLIITRTCGMKARGRLADQFLKARLDIHMNVFKTFRKCEFPRFDLGGDFI